MPIAAFLVGIVGTLAGRVLLSLGIGFVSYAGITAALNAVRGHIDTAWAAGGDILNIMYLAGMGEAVGILLAAMTVRGALYAVSSLQRITA